MLRCCLRDGIAGLYTRMELRKACRPVSTRLDPAGDQIMEVYFENLTGENASLGQLAEDVSALLHDAETLVQASGASLSQESRAELESTLARLKASGTRIKQQALSGARATDRVIRKYPYQSLGVVFGLGIVLGVLLKRK
jgi:ElaB/YqjD/DUF883 family membrane-anchored ribosome-binding protein